MSDKGSAVFDIIFVSQKATVDLWILKKLLSLTKLNTLRVCASCVEHLEFCLICEQTWEPDTPMREPKTKWSLTNTNVTITSEWRMWDAPRPQNPKGQAPLGIITCTVIISMICTVSISLVGVCRIPDVKGHLNVRRCSDAAAEDVPDIFTAAAVQPSLSLSRWRALCVCVCVCAH